MGKKGHKREKGKKGGKLTKKELKKQNHLKVIDGQKGQFEEKDKNKKAA